MSRHYDDFVRLASIDRQLHAMSDLTPIPGPTPNYEVADSARDVISCRVRSLFTLFMLVALVMGQGTSLATSICRHASVQAHVAARRSADSRKAVVAFAEEAADAVAAKKGSTSNGAADPVLAALLPPSPSAARMFPRENMLPPPTDRPRLAGLSLRPPLPPPVA
jgi:hypothetical protein